jgi:hypothetical protein
VAIQGLREGAFRPINMSNERERERERERESERGRGRERERGSCCTVVFQTGELSVQYMIVIFSFIFYFLLITTIE